MDIKTVINLGLSQLGAYSISSLSPAVTPLEKRCAANYEQWARSELTKRRWTFASRVITSATEGGGPDKTANQPYSFAVPNDCLRLIRSSGDRWTERGNYIYYSGNTLPEIEYIARVIENNFDPLFVDTLAARIAWDMCEHVTQSNMKKTDAERRYEKTISVASAANALTLGSDDQSTTRDDDDEWLTARSGAGL